jgi:ankyrin repeat protein
MCESNWIFDAISDKNMELASSIIENDREQIYARELLGTSTVIAAVASDTPEMVNLLLRHGIDPNGMSCDHETPICAAIKHSKQNAVTIIRALLDAGADIERPGLGGKPLQCAVRFANVEMVQFLIERGADVNGRSEPEGTTAMWHAAFLKSREVFLLLLHNGADPSLRDEVIGKSPLELNNEVESWIDDARQNKR